MSEPAVRAPFRAATADPVLSVIIVTWNVRELTLQCLRSLEERSDGIPLEAFVVDNASTDGTVAAVRERFPWVTVIANPVNVGFPRANNQALERARGRYVLFLNPDTVVGEGTLQACVAELENDPGIGMVGSRLVYPDGTVQYEGARNRYLLRHLAGELLYLHMLFPRHRVFGHHLMGDWDHLGVRDVDAICGAFMMARRSLVQELGGMPDEIFMYHEDLALCLRIRNAGWRIRYRGDVVTTHYTNQSGAQSTSRLTLLEGEAKLRFIREAQGDFAAAVGRVLFLIRSLIRLGISAPAHLVPGLCGVRRRYPRVFDTRLHLLNLLWSLSPRLVRRWMPRPPADAVDDGDARPTALAAGT